MIGVVVVDKLIWGGLSFVLDKVAQAVDAELDAADRLREELLAAQMRHELGEIGADELARIESEILARLREIQLETSGGAPAGPISFGGAGGAGVGGVEIDFEGDEHEPG